jgi:tRNA pseudouridine55 synthase
VAGGKNAGVTRRHDHEPVEPGLLVVDKPAGMTSHDVVAKVRRILGTRRVGHAGTLDPMATGVLVLGVERATRLLGHLALGDKAYLATIRLGASTSTDDAEGEVIGRADAGGVDEPAIRAGIAALTGKIEQVPSAVSAVKVGGERAYRLVRRGERVELAARPVTVSRFDLLELRREPAETDLDVEVECSSGTYVRALARDLGAELGVGGHLVALRRTRVGPFGIGEALTLDRLTDRPRPSLSLDVAVAHAFPVREVDAGAAADLSYGRALPPAGIAGTYGVFDRGGHAIGLVAERDGAARPVLVLRPAGG